MPGNDVSPSPDTVRLTKAFNFDRTGKLFASLELVEKYKPFIPVQHSRLMAAWREKRHSGALVELHFMLIATMRVRDGFRLAAPIVPGLGDHLGTIDLAPYKRARDHFEHIDDRLYGSRRGALKAIDGRTRHYGLLAASVEFGWSDEKIDISDGFLTTIITYFDEADAIIDRCL